MSNPFSNSDHILHELAGNVTFDFDIEALARAIIDQKAVVYTGAGTSMPAGLPGWHDFLMECLTRAKSSLRDPERFRQAESLLREGDYLTSAGLLQLEIGQSLEHYIYERFHECSVPSQIHMAIARIPFSLAITTNYDRLLESAYKIRPNVWTWRDPAALFNSIKHRRFAVVKVHGDVGNPPSLVLTKTQYRDMMHLNRAFNESLVTLLCFRTFLFVGSSLRDRDLLHLMDTAKLLHGAEFGPHYAITFEDEVDNTMQKLLRESYNVHCVVCGDPKHPPGDWRTEAVCSFLKHLSGQVASMQSLDQSVSILASSTFCLRSATQHLIDKTVQNTGSDRGQVYLVKDKKHPVIYKIASNPTQFHVPSKATPSDRVFEPSAVSSKSTIGKVFLLGTHKGYYCKSLQHDDSASSTPGNIMFNPVEFHPDSKSALVCQVMADGSAVGVICLESNVEDAFTPEHLRAAKNASEIVGEHFIEFQHRSRAKEGIRPYLSAMAVVEKMMNMSRQLRPLGLKYVLYDIDYWSGFLSARYSTEGTSFNDAFTGYYFEQKSLATHVFKERASCFRPDAGSDIKNGGVLAALGVEHFKIDGPVYATPVRISGETSTILVCWSTTTHKSELRLHTDRIDRLVRLIAQGGSTPIPVESRDGFKFVELLDKRLLTIDKGHDWAKKMLSTPKFQHNLFSVVMGSLIEDPCAFSRVRIWQRIGSPVEFQFTIAASMSSKSATGVGKKARDQYLGTTTDGSDPVVSFTVGRYAHDDLAKIHQPSMFDQPDSLANELDKAQYGSWQMAPIVVKNARGRKDIAGFISCDNHEPRDSRIVERNVSNEHAAFQGFAMDLVTDILSKVMWTRYLESRRLTRGIVKKKK